MLGHSWPDPNFTALFILGVGGPMLGAGHWLKWPWLTSVLATSLVVWGGFALALRQPWQGWAPALGLGAAYLLVATAHFCREAIARMLGTRRPYAGLFLIAGPLLAGAWAHYFDQLTQPTMMDDAKSSQGPVPVPEYVLTQRQAFTDQDHPIPLFVVGSVRPSESELYQSEQRTGRSHLFALIRTASPETDSNCHGWLFADNRYCVRGREVDTILKDNGYETVEQPKRGDIIVFRETSGKVLHSGLVRVATGHLTLIESKWGVLGCYLHAPADQPYSQSWMYYRSRRPGHNLRIDGEVTPMDAEIATEE